MKKSVLAVKGIMFVVGLFLFIHSGALNELQLGFNEVEGWVGLGLVFISLFRFMRTKIQELI